jgi:tRNA dimethylallyltransferase
MFDAGVEQEVAQTLEEAHRENRPLSRTAQQAIGLEDLRAVLRGELDREEAIRNIQVATRRYAKRQETWFRRQVQAVTVNLSDTPAGRVIEILRELGG